MTTFKAAERIRETSTTTGTGTYTLAGAPTGYQPVNSIGANNYMPYFASDGTNWEVGIGQYVTGPDRLARDAVLASSNAGAAVNWGAGTRTIRSGLAAWLALPRSKSKSVAGGVDVTLTQEEQRCHILILTGALTGNINVIVDATPWQWQAIHNQTSGNFTLTVKVAGQTGVEVYQGRATPAVNNGTDVFKPDELPPGASVDYMGGTVQAGYLAEDGAAVSRTTFSALFNKIGTTHGVGNGSTTFNVPDSRRRVHVGSGGTGTGTLGNAVGNVGGAETHTLATGEIPAHTHQVLGNGSYNGVNQDLTAGSQGTNNNFTSGSTGGGGAHNNLPPSLVVTKMIRT